MSRRNAPSVIIVMPTQMDMAIDGSGQDVFARRIDIAVGGGQQLVWPNRHDLFALDGDAGFVRLRGGHYLTAANNGIDVCCRHRVTSRGRLPFESCTPVFHRSTSLPTPRIALIIVQRFATRGFS